MSKFDCQFHNKVNKVQYFVLAMVIKSKQWHSRSVTMTHTTKLLLFTTGIFFS